MKINLSDYDFQKDIENRLLMAKFSTLDLEVLEEILYNPLKIPVKTLAKNLDISNDLLSEVLQNLSKTGLFTIHEDQLDVDKDVRKYYESQILKFDNDFKPGMEFLQGLLKKVPIHVLPAWYSIPRTSNNIFSSIVEKYLFTPQIFQRHLQEVKAIDSVCSGIIDDIHEAKDFKVTSLFLKKKYGLTEEKFEEYLLFLEFNFVACLSYNKVEDRWEEVVTPFYEWKSYLQFLRESEVASIHSQKIVLKRDFPFAFVRGVTAILKEVKKEPLSFNGHFSEEITTKIASNDPELEKEAKKEIQEAKKVFSHTAQKLIEMKVLKKTDHTLEITDTALEFLDYDEKNKAIFLYRHPYNRILSYSINDPLASERNIRDAEKTAQRVLNKGWVFFDEYIQGVYTPFADLEEVQLHKNGKNWSYTLPKLMENHKKFLYALIFEWLYEVGMVEVGSLGDRPCFKVTDFGRSFFEI